MQETNNDQKQKDNAEPAKVPMCVVSYDKPDMMKAESVTIIFNLENVSRMAGGIGLDFCLGRMERIKNDLAVIICDKQQKRAELSNPAGSLKIVQ